MILMAAFILALAVVFRSVRLAHIGLAFLLGYELFLLGAAVVAADGTATIVHGLIIVGLSWLVLASGREAKFL